MPVYGKASTLNYKSLDQDLNYQLLEADLLVIHQKKSLDQTHIADFLPWTHLKRPEGVNQYWNEFLLDDNVGATMVLLLFSHVNALNAMIKSTSGNNYICQSRTIFSL